MTPEQIELAKRLVRAKHFRWKAGMRFRWVAENGRVFRLGDRLSRDECQDGIPDLTDFATFACVVMQVLELEMDGYGFNIESAVRALEGV